MTAFFQQLKNMKVSLDHQSLSCLNANACQLRYLVALILAKRYEGQPFHIAYLEIDRRINKMRDFSCITLIEKCQQGQAIHFEWENSRCRYLENAAGRHQSCCEVLAVYKGK